MNTLTVLCLVVAVACTSGQLVHVAHPGVYGYPGVFGAYPGLLPYAAPITVKSGTPSTITLKTVAPSPITLKTVAAAPIPAVSPITYNVAPVAQVESVAPVVQAAPVASVAHVGPVAPVVPFQSKFHAQDELGQYSFGYNAGPSTRAETRDAFGIVRGSYNYVDAEGKVQTQHYVADGLGFRVSGTNLPVAPEAPETPALIGPEPVQDTPEVAAAKVTFRSLLEKAAAAPASEPVAEAVSEPVSEDVAVARKKRAAVTPVAYPYASPLRFSYGYSTPLTYSHPAVAYSAPFPAVTPYSGIPVTTYSGVPVTAFSGIPAVTTYSAAAAAPRDATLLRVENNPGHAVSYRAD